MSNFSSAMLDVPVRSSDSNAALLFDAFTERIPPIGTPVTIILTPRRDRPAEEGSDQPAKKAGEKPAEHAGDAVSPSR